MTVPLDGSATGLVWGAVVPHAPVLAAAQPDGRVGSLTSGIRKSLRGLVTDGCDAVVIVSPHGTTAGVYKTGRADLDGFGVPDQEIDAATDPQLASILAGTWNKPALSSAPDHGVSMPVLLTACEAPVLGCALAETTGPDASATTAEALEDAERLAGAIQKLTSKARLGVMASAHTAACMNPRAPLGERLEGRDLDEAIAAALEEDPAGLLAISPDLWAAAGSCGAGPLTVFGALFAGVQCRLLAREAPFGVGYVVAASK